MMDELVSQGYLDPDFQIIFPALLNELNQYSSLTWQHEINIAREPISCKLAFLSVTDGKTSDRIGFRGCLG